jgi:hypothetical protein
MSEVDPDPYEPGGARRALDLGGAEAPDAGDPTQGGKRGEVGSVPSITRDEPDGPAQGYPVGGGRVTEETDAAPVADPGPGA